MNKDSIRICFLNLTAFSRTGGIEKFNRCLIKALHELDADVPVAVETWSVYDLDSDSRYCIADSFQGFGGKKFSFLIKVLRQLPKVDILILGHINLYFVGLILKFLNPRCKLIVAAHGIEVWNIISFGKRLCVKMADLVLCVSRFTRDRIDTQFTGSISNKLTIFPNTIDPYFGIPYSAARPQYLLDRYAIASNKRILLTITRLSSDEKYKGYDAVIQSIASDGNLRSNLIYLIGGKADELEKNRLENLIKQNGLEDVVFLLGFISDLELIDHYLLADVFVMPSRSEGFGIVFLEAVLCGNLVIAGNIDGSRDALLDGELGVLVNPDDIEKLSKAIGDAFLEIDAEKSIARSLKVLDNFGFPKFQKRLNSIIGKLIA